MTLELKSDSKIGKSIFPTLNDAELFLQPTVTNFTLKFRDTLQQITIMYC